MARINRSTKEELSYWINANGDIEYHSKCARCAHKCKQSFRCLEVICPKYRRR
jgi:hypothetical protein